MIAVHKNLLKLILKSISKSLKVSKNLKWKKLSRNHTFLFLFPLTLDSFLSNWQQNLKRVLVLEHSKSLIYKQGTLAEINWNLRKKERKLYLYSTSLKLHIINFLSRFLILISLSTCDLDVISIHHLKKMFSMLIWMRKEHS